MASEEGMESSNRDEKLKCVRGLAKYKSTLLQNNTAALKQRNFQRKEKESSLVQS